MVNGRLEIVQERRAAVVLKDTKVPCYVLGIFQSTYGPVVVIELSDGTIEQHCTTDIQFIDGGSAC